MFPSVLVVRKRDCQESCVRGHTDADGGREGLRRELSFPGFAGEGALRSRADGVWEGSAGSSEAGTVRNLVCGAILTPMEGDNGYLERDLGPIFGWERPEGGFQ